MTPINIVKPTAEDLLRAEAAVAPAWLTLERAMLSTDRNAPSPRQTCATLLDAIDMRDHVTRRYYNMTPCAPECSVCKRAAEQKYA